MCIRDRFRENEEGRIYGVTFIDHRNREVYNGSRLGKEDVYKRQVKHTVLHVERIEGYRIALLIGEIDAVLAMRSCMDKAAQSLIGISRVHQQHMLSLIHIWLLYPVHFE